MTNPNKLRHKARCLAVQALYQAQFADHQSVDSLIQSALEGMDLNKIDYLYLNDLIKGVTENKTKVDETLHSFLDRDISKLNPVELAVLRLATYELLFRPDIPHRVVLNEAIELAKKYGSVQGYKYINGVLDKVSTLRPH